MLQNYNTYKLLKVFLYSPTESFRLRELSRISKISPVSVINYLKSFEKQKLMKKYEKRDIPFYQAERDNEKFKLYQKMSIQYELNNSNLIDYIWENCSPEAIILFGSFANGEAVESSDIDICIIGKEKQISLEKYEKLLNKHIHLTFYKNTEQISKEMKNNLINGIILKGYFEAIK